ncbi:hypothetical protein M3O96_21470 [Aquiflexum sp. TKW24L]|uniref:hypothetical protein n=1 Tax=Aquiflexum sp. TKW24L TaxID=2942212 RepID=UPI0020BDA6A5|nr:hypothetical protein [Aquiflexum sp. TKW24L]MCL6261679.1 hypothetical protein [Aquiflexum sp. TKW24L]
MTKNFLFGFTFTKSALQPILLGVFLMIGFHFVHFSNFGKADYEATFYEISNTKVSTPCPTFEFLQLADLITFEKEEKEEKSESESSIDFALNSGKTLFAARYFRISGAANQSLKIPSIEGKSPLYILFHSLRVHLA